VNTYKIQLEPDRADGGVRQPCAVLRSDGWSIPLHPDNTDFQTFVKELTVDFTILQDADGKQADQGTIKAILKIRNNQ